MQYGCCLKTGRTALPKAEAEVGGVLPDCVVGVQVCIGTPNPSSLKFRVDSQRSRCLQPSPTTCSGRANKEANQPPPVHCGSGLERGRRSAVVDTTERATPGESFGAAWGGTWRVTGCLGF